MNERQNQRQRAVAAGRSAAAGSWGGFLLVLLLLLALYLATLMPGTLGGDAGELQYAGPLWTLVHPTGQPLYVTLGWLWSHALPLGTMAQRMNALGALSAAAGAALMGLFVGRLTGRVGLGAATGLTLGLGGTVWGQAQLADKYGFNVLLSALIVGCALLYAQAGAERRQRWFYITCAAFGIGLLHHRSLLLFAPGLALLVVAQERGTLWRRPGRSARGLALALLPALVVYPITLPLLLANGRSPYLWQPGSAGEWLLWLQERDAITGEALVFDSFEAIAPRLLQYVTILTGDYTAIVPLVALLGIGLLARGQRLTVAFLLLTYLPLAVLAANWRGHERQFTYYIPSFVLLLYSYGLGAGAIARLGRRGRGVILLGVWLLPALLLARHWPEQRLASAWGEPLGVWRQVVKSGDMGARLTARMADLPRDAVVVGDWEQMTILWYQQQVSGVRPDLEIIYPIDQHTDHLDGERPLCVARGIPGLGTGDRRLTHVGALACLQTEPVRLPDLATSHGIEMRGSAGTWVLEASRLAPGPYRAGRHVPLAMWWRAEGVLEDLSLSLRLLDEMGTVRWSADQSAPVLGMYPTSLWASGERVEEYREITLPPDLPPGRYRWAIVVYPAADPNAPLTDPAGSSLVPVGELLVE